MEKEQLVELCARIAHEANRAYCESIGDSSQLDWVSAPDWQKESARLGVIGALDGNTPEESHVSWLKKKLEDGWKYGPVKDADKREHPCMVSYSQLPKEQRLKDAIFVGVVRAVGAVFMKG